MNIAQHRNRTASTPDLKVDHQKGVLVTTLPKENIKWLRIYRIWTLIYNMHVIEITLDGIIMVAGFIHLAAAIILIVHENLIFMILKQEIHVLIRTTFITLSLVLLIYSIIALYFLRKGRQRRATHAACSLIMALIMLFVASMQNRVETNILKNMEMSILSMIDSETIYLSSFILDKFHTMFKCCGAKGNLDWCRDEKFLEETNLKTDQMDSKNLLGIYICHIPISCCVSSINEYNISMVSDSENLCSSYPTPWNTYRPGCLTPLKLEIYYMGTIYRVICYTTIIVLLLSMASSILLCIYP
ncbi:hypothetical protein M0802_008230 [Mischocyttarus mexicanus]|nr:hypothetical protein M0802_008230 [Mischocyttarus mexicanus]